MYKNEIEIYFFEDEKSVSFVFVADTLTEVKKHDIALLIYSAGHQYSMLTSEVVVTSIITCNNEYIDSDENFSLYDSKGTVKGKREELKALLANN